MLYELRNYDPMPGKRPALDHLFANHTVGFFKKYGIGILGFWDEEIGTTFQLTLILSFESMGDRELKWAAFSVDSDWQKARLESEKEGPLIASFHNRFMRLTPYSPEPKITSNVQELRIYEAEPGKLPALHDRFANHTTGFFRKYGMEVIGYWTNETDTSNQLVYMLGYPSLGDREKSWAAFMADPDWHKAMEESHRDGILCNRVQNRILRRTAYSP